jgi:hypothetical protein
MQSATKSELQMLRELVRYYAQGRVCYFCKRVLIDNCDVTFGHRHHSPVVDRITLHHLDEDRENNRKENLIDCHTACHRSHHARKRATTRRELSLPTG